MSHWEEAKGKTQDTLEGLCLWTVLGTPWDPPGRAGGEQLQRLLSNQNASPLVYRQSERSLPQNSSSSRSRSSPGPVQIQIQSRSSPDPVQMKRSVTVQPQSLVFMRDASEWSTDLCDCCCDCKTCCRSFWCFPCLACQTVKLRGECLCLPLLDVCGCIHPIAMSLRTSTRERYSIRGSFCVDCLLSTCCCPCVYCQVHREFQHRQLPSMLSDIVQRK
ncbi:hypothetical protein WMY93_007927 [Mugilogobius chulae]|uniref:Cornifelin n=1 Tax=Mugilogobius chulae TaxID=88201 RepID=A0AAW0PJG3_9GOBI